MGWPVAAVSLSGSPFLEDPGAGSGEDHSILGRWPRAGVCLGDGEPYRSSGFRFVNAQRLCLNSSIRGAGVGIACVSRGVQRKRKARK